MFSSSIRDGKDSISAAVPELEFQMRQTVLATTLMCSVHDLLILKVAVLHDHAVK